MKWTSRKLFALLVAAAGAYLLIYEIRDYRTSEPFEAWFWMAIAVLAILLALIEILSKTPPRKP